MLRRRDMNEDPRARAQRECGSEYERGPSHQSVNGAFWGSRVGFGASAVAPREAVFAFVGVATGGFPTNGGTGVVVSPEVVSGGVACVGVVSVVVVSLEALSVEVASVAVVCAGVVCVGVDSVVVDSVVVESVVVDSVVV